MSKNNLTQKGFYKDSSIYLSAALISTAISFITLPIFTRYLSPADYGVFALFALFANVSSGFISIGIHKATYRYFFKFKGDKKRFSILNSSNLVFIIISFFLSGFLIYHLSNWISFKIFDGRIIPSLIQLSFINGFMQFLITYFTGILNAQNRAIAFSVITVMSALLRNVISLFFVFQYSFTYLAKIYGAILSHGIITVCLIILFRNLFIFRFSLSDLKTSIKFSYPQIPRDMMSLAYSSFDKVMLNKFKGLTSITHYMFGANFAGLIKTIMDAFGRTWTPFFLNKAHQGGSEAKSAIIERYFNMISIISIFGLGIIYFSEEAVKLLTTEEFYPSIYVVPIYVFYFLFGIPGMLLAPQLMFAEKMAYGIPTTFISVVLNIILNLILIPKFGAVGAAIATMIASMLMCFPSTYFGQKAYYLPLNYWKLFSVFLILFIFTLPVYYILELNINFIIKIAIKIGIILSFILIEIRFGYISIDKINKFYNKVKISFTT
jgi:O-antigen/teichoic acid export membrane protein